ncbi:hemoglobin subunit alpha-like [Mobula birostris]|uniref:hemoglobin subunit alpha-like n=1 Tax=Mobula birostris TaxID=1983395 RepID=UPI003B28852A
MAFSDSEKQIMEEIGNHIKANAEAWGADALVRLFKVYPQTKRNFKKFTGFEDCDPSVRNHGRLVMNALADAAHDVDHMGKHLEGLAIEYREELQMDPHYIHLLTNCIVLTLAIHLPTFTPAYHCAVGKFLKVVSDELSSKYQ